MADIADALANPILNGPYDPPERHFVLGSDGPTGETNPGRRPSESFIPIPQERKGKRASAEFEQQAFDLDMTGERREANETINGLRRDIDLWRARNYHGVTPISRKLLDHWADPTRENRVLFCQREAAETAIFLVEVAGRQGYTDWRRGIDAANDEHNAGLPRIALKMATGSGKTVVMAMLIAWQTLNKVQSPRDVRFTNKFLIIAPGITIRDRLRVLLPNEPGNYFDERDLIPADLRGRLGDARVVVVNYHAFLPRVRKEFQGVARLSKEILAPGATGRFDESPAQIVSRVLRDFGSDPGQIAVLNDEAHHCYQDKPSSGALSKEERDANADARVWFKGLQAIAGTKGYGIKQIFDVSATPFYLGGSGWNEGYIFPWTVSDFSLMDAIESGIVKIPRLPVDDDAEGETTTYRNLWEHIGTQLPKRAASATIDTSGWVMPAELESALRSLYRSYRRSFDTWERTLREHGEPPPVMIVVCPNTLVSRLVHEWVAGAELDTGVLRPGRLELLDNTSDGAWLARPRTILIDSAQLESGDALSKDFKDAASTEIAAFQDDWRRANPGMDVDQLTDEDLLREVMNTVGKRGKLGEQVRCVVSVAMLTEGWDANTVTHILGVRAFGSQLLCEQVIGRGLRRRSYALNDEGRFDPEYANVYGIPFAFIPGERPADDPKPQLPAIEVASVPDRESLRISFPRVEGYRIEMPEEELYFEASDMAPFIVGPDTVPNWTEIGGIVGANERDEFDVDDRRPPAVVFELTDRLLKNHFSNQGLDPRPWLFPKLLPFVREWMSTKVQYRDGFHPWHLLKSTEAQHEAIEHIHRAIHWQGQDRPEFLRPILDRFAPTGDTSGVAFVTRKRTFETVKSEISHVVLDGADGNTWEQILALECERNADVAAYVKNDHLGFAIPYVHKGRSHRYVPDFLLRLKRIDADVERTLIVEVSGGQKKAHSPGAVAVKAETAQKSWCTAVNNHGGFGAWGYIEIDSMVDVTERLCEAIASLYAGDPIVGDYQRLERGPRAVLFQEVPDGA
ncbi:BPTD_3080 family restriction endonuclease [Microbacterium sp. CJ88]|uniref:BPTD_3080 family restriction endonuclease n=1 Tax=Microbacterium sp. CJ88 TaxID=3445672 RepID=UPI003F65C3BA